METIWLLARLILAGVFALAGIGKMLDIPGSIKAVQGFGIPQRLSRPIGIALPIIELAIALLLLPVSTALVGAIGGALLLVAFLGGMINSLRKGEAPDCHCFGQIHSEPVGTSTIVRNGVLLVLALLVVTGGESPGHSLTGWLGDETGAVQVLVIVVAVLTIAVGGLLWLVTHLLGQNGRMLIRMDEIAAEAKSAGPAQVAAAPATPRAKSFEVRKAPAFAGTGLIGEKVTLDGLLEAKKPIMLIFSDPGCGPCKTLQPEIAKWQTEHAADLTIALITRGSIDDAREKIKPSGIKHVVIEKDRAISRSYDANGTPSAVLIGIDGNIASAVAGGADAIRTLLQTALEKPVANGNGSAKPAQQRPPAPPVGSVAPEFTLPKLAGGDATLSDVTKKEAILLFWNPGCGFCKRMQPDLHEWASSDESSSIDLVAITVGTREAAEELTFADHVFLETSFTTARSFGASGTPSAIRVSADGNIASGLAVGGPAIMTMLREPAAVSTN
jgi:thiol-disulfide isomerase/thioredoxin/uncharacterized membrane protein YphA (DoxX/SURF4 family)